MFLTGQLAGQDAAAWYELVGNAAIEGPIFVQTGTCEGIRKRKHAPTSQAPQDAEPSMTKAAR